MQRTVIRKTTIKTNPGTLSRAMSSSLADVHPGYAMRPKVYADGKVDIKRQREDEKCKSNTFSYG